MATSQRYDEDLTGTNPNNMVVGEIARLSAKKRRAVIPKYGPFFKKGFTIWDVASPEPLLEGQHFDFVDISDILTGLTGKGIYYCVIIKDETVSDTVRMNYQNVGGLHMFSAANLQELYENSLKNDTPVDWTTGVINKPLQYPPPRHSHHIGEWYGFEPLIAEFERMRKAIVMSGSPAFETIVSWVKNRGMTIEDILNGNTQDKFLTYDAFMYLSKTTNFNSLSVVPEVVVTKAGDSAEFNIHATNMDDGSLIHWELELDGMKSDDFYAVNGVVTMDDKEALLAIRTKSSTAYSTPVRYRFHLRAGSNKAPRIFTSKWITVEASSFRFTTHAAMNACCMLSPKIARTAKSLSITGSYETF